MARLFFLTVMLFALAGSTFWYLAHDSTLKKGAMETLAKFSKIKKIQPLADAGNAEAQYKLAAIYETGDGASKNQKKAFDWYLKSAEKGFGASQYKVGSMYASGVGVRQNFFMAAKWYRLAATFNKNTLAEFRLGELYFNGRGVEHDYGKAIEFYTKAARKGHAASQYLLGSMYEDGWGVPLDYIKAYVWLKRAIVHKAEALAVHKRYDPEKKIKILMKKMNRFQIEEAEKRLLKLGFKR